MSAPRGDGFTDAQVARAIAGDRAAVGAIVAALLPRVYGLALRLSGRRDTAEEATQETFVRALRALPTLRDPSRLVPFTLAIAANTTRETAQARGRTLPLEVDLPETRRDPSPAIAARQAAAERAVAKLPPDERELFLLHAVEGVGLEEIARERRRTVSAVKAHVHRIRGKVRDMAAGRLRVTGAGRDDVELMDSSETDGGEGR